MPLLGLGLLRKFLHLFLLQMKICDEDDIQFLRYDVQLHILIIISQISITNSMGLKIQFAVNHWESLSRRSSLHNGQYFGELLLLDGFATSQHHLFLRLAVPDVGSLVDQLSQSF